MKITSTASSLGNQKKQLQAAPKVTTSKSKGKARDIKFSLAVGLTGEDTDMGIFYLLAEFLQQRASSALIAFERGGTNCNIYIQGVAVISSSSAIMIKRKIVREIGWSTNPSSGIRCVSLMWKKSSMDMLLLKGTEENPITIKEYNTERVEGAMGKKAI
ncbi:hypothetical protein R1flu_018597 [Riccia fluitans]|uniref:Uncharacterized protein n=1 Tax=Riccia fluitans TaxID=41844 RepID=A0ABD1ZJT7_9MARC